MPTDNCAPRSPRVKYWRGVYASRQSYSEEGIDWTWASSKGFRALKSMAASIGAIASPRRGWPISTMVIATITTLATTTTCVRCASENYPPLPAPPRAGFNCPQMSRARRRSSMSCGSGVINLQSRHSFIRTNRSAVKFSRHTFGIALSTTSSIPKLAPLWLTFSGAALQSRAYS